MRVVEEKKISPKIEETPKSKINIASIIKKNGIKENSEAIEGNLDFLTKLLEEDSGNYEPPIEDAKLNMIRDDLTRNYSQEVLQALTDDEIRRKLVQVVLKEHGTFFKKDKEVAEYVVRECIGTGIIERIMTNDEITDVGWNGSQLSIETNSNKWLFDGDKLNITQEYIERVISKYAVVNDRAFNSGNPIMDGMFKNVRISATHIDNSPDGSTFSMRVARPRLALNKENFEDFAPDYILELFEKMMKTKANICISGETGTGKTELQKLLLSFIDNHDRMIMIEDVQETHAKELFPDKDIFSWITTPKKAISDLVKASLRNNPRWIIVSETRGSEAYEMLQAVLSGHYVVTTLHAINARAIPRRFVNMCASGFKINENAVEEDINRYFDFGVHIKKTVVDGKVIRYLNEIVEFSANEPTTVFKQKFINGKFVIENGSLSEDFKEKMAEKFITFEFPEDQTNTEESLPEEEEVI
ncbi:CpaF/VirB11 family protein [Enterococcus faecium]|uniref:CpaF/VirB11 family protein n=1 Tax=Enterococcus faecium TaxID=1352 RepID=UPI00224E4121|nr:CpaF/VirB11 family protein [Enterococcus faecium]MCX4088556.1 CpaF/VirB11 family protein [Enterococcus faecium]MDT6287885.1 CpaF/VirB11 family protein [Enterococcus faecium]MDT6315498.1 CpaF/VirB11 family protein [Enterococcus faecium]